MTAAALSRKRWGGGGLLLLALLAILLVAPLLGQRDNDHPLASSERFDACALMPPSLPVPERSSLRPGVDRCDVLDARGEAVLGFGLSSLRSMGATRRDATRDAYATWIEEVRASGAVDVHEQTGPWKHGTFYRLGTRNQLLVEDGGLLIVLDSDRLDASALVGLGARLATALREDPAAAD